MSSENNTRIWNTIFKFRTCLFYSDFLSKQSELGQIFYIRVLPLLFILMIVGAS